MTTRTQPKVRGLKAMVDHLSTHEVAGEGAVAVGALRSYISRLAEGAEALYNLHATRNPTETEGAHFKRVSTAAAKYGQEVVATIDRANASLHKGLTDSEARVKAKTNLVPNAYGEEVRNAFRAMSEQERQRTLTQLVKENRGPELAALINCPLILTGMTEKQRTDIQTAFISTHAPEEVDVQQALLESFNAVLTAHDTAKEIASAYNDPAILSEISKAEDAATAAVKAFNNTVGAA